MNTRHGGIRLEVMKTITNEDNNGKWAGLDAAQAKLVALFRGMVDHNGHSELQVEVKPLKKGRKDVVLSSGKDYHFVLKPAPEDLKILDKPARGGSNSL